MLGSIPSGPTRKPPSNWGLFFVYFTSISMVYEVERVANWDFLRLAKLTSKINFLVFFTLKVILFGAVRDAVWVNNLINLDFFKLLNLLKSNTSHKCAFKHIYRT